MELVRIGTELGEDADPALLDSRAASAWFAAEALIRHRLGINLSGRIAQALGYADASAGVHGDPGVCVDIRVWGWTTAQILAVVALLRESGFAGTWYRDWEGNEHIHAAADIGIWTPALYQITAVKAGYDGTGKAGKGGEDPHKRPSAWRTAQQGAAWAAKQLEDDMALSPEDRTWIRAELQGLRAGGVDLDTTQFLGRSGPSVGVALQDGYYNLVEVRRQVASIAVQVAALSGRDVTGEELAQELAALMAPVVQRAVQEAAQAGGAPEVIAAATVRLLTSTLAAGGGSGEVAPR